MNREAAANPDDVDGRYERSIDRGEIVVHAVVGVNISVGNAALQTSEDVADALSGLADLLRSGGRTLADIANGQSVRVTDLNGNRVGSLQVTGYDEEEI